VSGLATRDHGARYEYLDPVDRLHAVGILGVAAMVSLATVAPERASSGDKRTARATCANGGPATPSVDPKRDAVLGPLVLLRAERMASVPPNAFRHRGYKIPVTLPEGTVAVLSVPREMRGRVGLVFSPRTQDDVWKRGIDAADTAVKFIACKPSSTPGRTGWPGGLVVDRRRCVTLVVRVPGEAPVRRRVPLGRPC
jgi:hypothetical protein